MSTFLFHMLMFVIVAWVAYAFDRKYGRRLYRKWYDLSHDEPLPSETVRGFICGRGGKTKCSMATLVAIVTTIAMSALSKENGKLFWFFTGLVGIVAVLIGFISAPLVANIWGRRTKVYDAVDRIEASDPGKVIREKTGGAFSGLRNWWKDNWTGPSSIPTAPAPTSAPTPLGSPESVAPIEPTEMVPPASLDVHDATTGAVAPKAPKELSAQGKIDQFTSGGAG